MSTRSDQVQLGRFAEVGYAGPLRVLTETQCRELLAAAASAPEPGGWSKGRAASSRTFYEIGRHPAILEQVVPLLDGNVMLWGASIQRRSPGQIHPWHSDIESSRPSNRTIAVWIGLEGTTGASSLVLVPYSHRFGLSVQEVRHQQGKRRDETTQDDILRWARARDERAVLVQLDMGDGDAVFFDGKLWHGSHNLTSSTRHALLLQYATPDSIIRIPDLSRLDWPFRELERPRPPCLMVEGSDITGVNRVVPAPRDPDSIGLKRLRSAIYPLRVPQEADERTGWTPYPIFTGATDALERLSCHASVLTQGSCPHPPHTHRDEEILIVLSGEVEILLPDEQASSEGPTRRLTPGEFVYYPAGFAHTLTTVSPEPANYLMFKWFDEPIGRGPQLPFGRFRAFDAPADERVAEGFAPRLIFEGPTRYLLTLHGHASTLTPGAGYEPHVDDYDVAILVLEGEVETLDERVEPFGVIYYRAGDPHGLRNPGEVVAKYLVVEFHGTPSRRPGVLANTRARARVLAEKVTDPRAWKGKLRQEWSRLRRRFCP